MILDPPADAVTIEFHYTKLAASVKSAGNRQFARRGRRPRLCYAGACARSSEPRDVSYSKICCRAASADLIGGYMHEGLRVALVRSLLAAALVVAGLAFAREAAAEPAPTLVPDDGGPPKPNTFFEVIRAWLRRLAA